MPNASRAPADCDDAASVQTLARHLLGDELPHAGVVHVTALWPDPAGELIAIRIGEDAPKSAHDFFLLQLSRACSDAIVVTGKVLREEPTLRYRLEGPGSLSKGLAAYRSEVRGRGEAPRLCVLTGGRVDLAHPAFDGAWARPCIFTTLEAKARIDDEAAERGIEVVGHARPSIRAALEHLRSTGAELTTVEAGPATSRGLYDPPVAVDALALSLFTGELPESARGGAYASLSTLESKVGARALARRVDEPSGDWSFQLLQR